MLFDSNFLAGISAAPQASALQIIKAAKETTTNDSEWSVAEHEGFLEAYALLKAMQHANLITLDIFSPEIPLSHWREDCIAIAEYFNLAEAQLSTAKTRSAFEKMTDRFTTAIGSGFSYEFSQADVNRMQTLINELRENISQSHLFTSSHKARLLKRLEVLQAEVHKRISDLDKFWGLIGDAGVAMGKFGQDAKPFVDRIVEISQIVWNAQKDAEEIPSNLPMPLLSCAQKVLSQIEDMAPPEE
jgi:hypothetical protein